LGAVSFRPNAVALLAGDWGHPERPNGVRVMGCPAGVREEDPHRITVVPSASKSTELQAHQRRGVNLRWLYPS
jgi:hypothetical protein